MTLNEGRPLANPLTRHQNRPVSEPQRQKDGDKFIGGECGLGGVIIWDENGASIAFILLCFNLKLILARVHVIRG